jgi:hypothetical protein
MLIDCQFVVGTESYPLFSLDPFQIINENYLTTLSHILYEKLTRGKGGSPFKETFFFLSYLETCIFFGVLNMHNTRMIMVKLLHSFGAKL